LTLQIAEKDSEFDADSSLQANTSTTRISFFDLSSESILTKVIEEVDEESRY